MRCRQWLGPATSWATFWPPKKQSSQGESNYLHFRSTAFGTFFQMFLTIDWKNIENHHFLKISGFVPIFLPAAGYTLRYEVWWPNLDLEVCGIDSARRTASIGVVKKKSGASKTPDSGQIEGKSEFEETHVNNIEKSCNQGTKKCSRNTSLSAPHCATNFIFFSGQKVAQDLAGARLI